MATGTVIKFGPLNRKFALDETVEILQETLKQYRVRDKKGKTGWIDKACISLDEGGRSRPTTRSSSGSKPAVPKVKPWQKKPAKSPKLKRKPAHSLTLDATDRQKVPPCFRKDPCSGIYNLNWNQMSRLLPSYGVTDKEEVAALLRWWTKNLLTSPFKLNAVPTVLETALKNGRLRGPQIKKFVAKANSDAAPALPSSLSGRGVTELHRAGSRTYSELKTADGFHGWGGSMSVSHARLWATNYWGQLSQKARNSWLQDWKKQTRDKRDEMPFVATGWVSQKAGHSHRITVPFAIRDGMNAVLVHDKTNINQSTVFCVAGREEVVFLTGIPIKYIHKS